MDIQLLSYFIMGNISRNSTKGLFPELTAAKISPYAFKMAKKYFKPPKKPVKKVVTPKTKTPQEPLDSGFVVEIDPKVFNSTVHSPNPWIFLFYSPTCPHCQALEPIYLEAALQSKNRMNFAKVNCVEYGDFCQEKQVSGVPDLRIILQGKQLDKKVGELPLPSLVNFVKKYYAPKTARKSLHEVQSKIKLQSTTSSEPFLVLASNSRDGDSGFQGILSNLVGAGLTGEIILVEDENGT
ncbi:hypothetical protein DSO57_1024939 [Entomophthora muscae]|uniref:Uncharacterized protein n=1 Tax=Entomophthora muscae TaxID=34485 RepID=A0ACC2UN03_9FUNG|nr:hypothetical protein DSO57_1024939 [Entomophthora muscae]